MAQFSLKARAARIRPGLDDKSLTSWNAMMISALTQAHKAFTPKGMKNSYLKMAERNARWMLQNQVEKDGRLWHSYKSGTSSVSGLIEDYAFAIQAFTDLFEVTSKQKYLTHAAELMQYAKSHFEDTATTLFYTRSLDGEQLIARSLETVDNVIPAANSVMAQNLFRLGHYMDSSAYREQAEGMLNQVAKDHMLEHGENYSNWGQLLLKLTYPHYEVVVAGNKAADKYLSFQEHYLPNIIWIWTRDPSELPLLKNRFVKKYTRIYVCQDKVCQLPVNGVKKAMAQIRY
ncbi:MAG: hypothetical protein U5L96_20325 [Owenweeksia sp.]|nr:hypothetical protein [Owenweeksia sp.]